MPPSGALACTLSPRWVEVTSVITPDTGATISRKLSLSMFSNLMRAAASATSRAVCTCRRSLSSVLLISRIAASYWMRRLASSWPLPSSWALACVYCCESRASSSVSRDCATRRLFSASWVMARLPSTCDCDTPPPAGSANSRA
ncbi:hypothetical protein D3C85_1218730 [compost metagenome]